MVFPLRNGALHQFAERRPVRIADHHRRSPDFVFSGQIPAVDRFAGVETDVAFGKPVVGAGLSCIVAVSLVSIAFPAVVAYDFDAGSLAVE